MEKKIRIGAVSYLNTRPLLFGFREHPVSQRIRLFEDYPAKIASMLLSDEIDVGLVPVAILPRLKEYHLISDFCIGCDGPVASVALFGDVPLPEMEVILLDYQSRTSVMLLRVLLRDHWKHMPILKDAGTEDFRSQIKGRTGGLVIGDRAFDQALHSPVMYDLGQAWKDHTGLPFVFATWVANKHVDSDFIKAFNDANAIGLGKLDMVAAAYPTTVFDLLYYYRHNLSYPFDKVKHHAMDKFLSDMASL